MNIETKLVLKNIEKNKKRTVFTIISVILCTLLIATTILVMTSIRTSVKENTTNYHFAIKDLDVEEFNKIKDKKYIEFIYIQKNNQGQLVEIKELEKPLKNNDKINTYIRYNDIKKTYKYSNDIIRTLQF